MTRHRFELLEPTASGHRPGQQNLAHGHACVRSGLWRLGLVSSLLTGLTGCAVSTSLENQDGDDFLAWEDCNDLDPTVGAAYADVDGDGVGHDSPLAGCNQSSGQFVSATGDCDDMDARISPRLEELCDGLDNNCNGVADEGLLDPGAVMDTETLLDGVDSNCNGLSDQITTMAGTGECCAAGDDGPAATAILGFPAGIAFDGQQRLYITQPESNRVRRIDTSGVISTVAGTGAAGFTTDSDPLKTLLYRPSGVTIGADGRVFIADSGNNRVVMIDLNLELSTVAGPADAGELLPDSAEYQLRDPSGLSVTKEGRLLIADSENDRIAALDDFISKRLSTVAGTYQQPGVIGPPGEAVNPTSAGISRPAEDGKETAAPVLLNRPEGVLALENGDVLIADTGNHRILRSKTNIGVIETIVGTGSAGYSGDGGPGTLAQLNAPASLMLYTGGGLNLLFIADRTNNRIRMLDSTGLIRTVAGTGVAGYGGDGEASTRATLQAPTAVAVDLRGNLWISDQQNHRVRMVGW